MSSAKPPRRKTAGSWPSWRQAWPDGAPWVDVRGIRQIAGRSKKSAAACLSTNGSAVPRCRCWRRPQRRTAFHPRRAIRASAALSPEMPLAGAACVSTMASRLRPQAHRSVPAKDGGARRQSKPWKRRAPRPAKSSERPHPRCADQPVARQMPRLRARSQASRRHRSCQSARRFPRARRGRPLRRCCRDGSAAGSGVVMFMG